MGWNGTGNNLHTRLGKVEMLRPFKAVVFATICFLAAGCSNELIYEFPDEFEGQSVEISELRLVTYNIHGGKGPNGEGDFSSNLIAFKALLQGEEILCFQEVEPDCWNQLKSIFSEYPYRYFLPQKSTKFGTNKQGGNAILSKLPIATFDQKLIQTDPGGDKWERKAQYIRVYVGNDRQYINLFHYHNTYNWHNNNSNSEKAGFQNFMNWVASKSLSQTEINVVIGDFNLSKTQCDQIVEEERFPNSESYWVDHIYMNGELLNSGNYPTADQLLSDHQAVWSVLCNLDC